MTTRQIMDSSEDGLGKDGGPGFSFRGAGYISRSTSPAVIHNFKSKRLSKRERKARALYKLILDERASSGYTAQDYRDLARLIGRVI